MRQAHNSGTVRAPREQPLPNHVTRPVPEFAHNNSGTVRAPREEPLRNHVTRPVPEFAHNNSGTVRAPREEPLRNHVTRPVPELFPPKPFRLPACLRGIRSFLPLFLLTAACATPATKVAVTVIEQKSGKPVTGLKASDFTVMDDRTPRQVEAAEFSSSPIDVMLLLDTSLVGEAVRPVAGSLISQLQDKEQMAIVSFHSSADLVQDFTSSRELLDRAVAGVKYGNTPRVLDAVYAAVDGGFEGAAFRRVLVILTAGYEGQSRMVEKQVIQLARRNAVSIYPVYVAGAERSLFEGLARQTGGASFSLREMRKTLTGPPGPRIFEVLRSHYTLTLGGNLSLGERLKIEIQRPGKFLVSALPLE
jgi:hypothetical protein